MENENETEAQPEQETRLPVKKAQLVANDGGYIKPNNIEEVYRMATAVVDAGWSPDTYRGDPKKVAFGLMTALEAGLPPIYGMRQIAIINNRPTMWGDALMALVQSKNLIESYVEEKIGTTPTTNDLTKWPDDYGYRVTVRRRGQEGAYVGEYTVGRAKLAKLWLNARKPPWLENPERMLNIRARAFPLRDGFADAFAGIAIREEVEDSFGQEERHVEIDLEAAPKVESPPMPEEEEV